jgi:preprotein translocase subunit SecY
LFLWRGPAEDTGTVCKKGSWKTDVCGQSTHLPLKINAAGVIPPIFASSVLSFPLMISNFVDVNNIPWLQATINSLNPGHVIYNIIYVLFIIFFCYFYTAVNYNPMDIAENMKKQGGLYLVSGQVKIQQTILIRL